MKKLYIIAFFTLMALSASAEGEKYYDKVLLNEDFSWVVWTGTDPTSASTATTGEVRIDLWNAASNNHGWTSKNSAVYTRPGYLKLGRGEFGGDLCSPKLAALGESENVTVTLTFQAVKWENDPGTFHVAVLNAGTISTVSSGTKDDPSKLSAGDYDIKSSATITLGVSSGNNNDCWNNELSKYTITIEGATAETQILFVDGTYAGKPTDRACIDNVKVVTRTQLDESDYSTIILKKEGRNFAFKNSEVSDINFDYSANVDPALYEPETIIQREVIGGLPSEIRNPPSYEGAKISLNSGGNYAFDATSFNCVAGQSGAANGDYLFVVENHLWNIHMYDLKNNKMVAKCALGNMQTVSPKEDELYHCNQATFGTEKFADTDDFPLLYVSQRSKYYGEADPKNHRCFVNVLRILPTKDGEGKYTSFSVQEVQTIYLPAATGDYRYLGNANFTIDPQTGDFYTYSRNNMVEDADYTHCKITKFKKELAPAPHTLDGAEGTSVVTGGACHLVYLTTAAIEYSYYIYLLDGTTNVSAFDMQGAFIWNKKLYISQGIPNKNGTSRGNLFLRVVDMEKRSLVNNIPLDNDGFTQEPEGLFMHDGKMKMSTNGKDIFTFYFQ